MRFTQKENMYRVIRFTAGPNNILGVSFDEDNKNNSDIEVVEWPIPDGAKIIASKYQFLNQVLFGLKSVNQSLGINYQLSKIYFVPSDDPSSSVYTLLISKLIKDHRNGNQFEEIEDMG